MLPGGTELTVGGSFPWRPQDPRGVARGSPEHWDKCGLGGGVSHSHITYLLAQVPTLETVPQEEGPSVFQALCNRASGTGAGVTGEVGHQAGFA